MATTTTTVQGTTTTSTTTSTTQNQCATSTLGMHLDDMFLIQRVPRVVSESLCCEACQGFDLCQGWSFNTETEECKLFSSPTEGAIPTDTQAFDWVSGAIIQTDPPQYHCSSDDNCADCLSASGVCTRCTNDQYLLAGQCVGGCEARGYIEFGERLRGRECVAPFTCTTPTCECPSSQFGKFCQQCWVDFGDASECLECPDDRYLVDGRCRVEIVCRGYRYEEFPDVSCNCRTAEYGGNCFRCTHRGGFGAANPEISCVRCRNALYYDPESTNCVAAEECPAGTVPTNAGNYGRECQPPASCIARKHGVTGRTCRCFDFKDCHSCYFGESGHECTKCRNSKYLHNGECVSQCPESTAHANTRGSYNRKCTQAFTCDNEVSSLDGSLCVCPDQHCVTCHYEAGNSPGDSTCTACEAGYTLIQNQCVSD